MERAIEYYAGIGGFAAALRASSIEIELAVDIDREALSVHEANFDCPVEAAEIETFTFCRVDAHLWWASPPCRPFTRRGLQRGLADPRARSMMRLIEAVCQQQPDAFVLENVPPFAASDAARHIRRQLVEAGYDVDIEVRCPTELQIPNRRRRAYLLASRRGLSPLPAPPVVGKPLATYLDPDPPADLALPVAIADRYANAIDIVDAAAPAAMTSCFTSAYGKSPVRSGSYLKTPSGLRYFSPTEVARLLGYPKGFCFPPAVMRRRQWALLGNSLSVPVVKWVLSRVGLAPILHPRVG